MATEHVAGSRRNGYYIEQGKET